MVHQKLALVHQKLALNQLWCVDVTASAARTNHPKSRLCDLPSENWPEHCKLDDVRNWIRSDAEVTFRAQCQGLWFPDGTVSPTGHWRSTADPVCSLHVHRSFRLTIFHWPPNWISPIAIRKFERCWIVLFLYLAESQLHWMSLCPKVSATEVCTQADRNLWFGCFVTTPSVTPFAADVYARTNATRASKALTKTSRLILCVKLLFSVQNSGLTTQFFIQVVQICDSNSFPNIWSVAAIVWSAALMYWCQNFAWRLNKDFLAGTCVLGVTFACAFRSSGEKHSFRLMMMFSNADTITVWYMCLSSC